MPLRISESGIKPTSANKPAGEKSHSRRAVSAGLRDDFNQELSMKNPIRAVPTGRVLRLAIVATISATGWASTLSAEEATPLTEQQKIVHVLNRLGFGPRPGDVERVQKMGLDAYIHQQLNPQSIDDSAADAAVAPMDTLTASSSHLMTEYYAGIRKFIEDQRNSGDAEDMKLRYGIDPSKAPAPSQAEAPSHKAKMTPEDLAKKDELRCVGELQEAKIERAVLSERQLNEVMVDFWTNHFNIDIRKGFCRTLKTADDRDVIRPHVLGKFRDLLGASAHSPAMMFYLDNSQNSVTRERSEIEKKMIDMYVQKNLGGAGKGLIPDKEGPNENYGREILELHTLGVDGGYTQKDVQEVARSFTGWALAQTRGTFE